MRKNIQSSVVSNWKSYQAVAQSNIQSLEDLEIISYTRFNSSTRLQVGDNILVNGKLAQIGAVFVDEVYGHRYSITYAGMGIGHEEIIFTIEWVEDVSLLPEDNNLTGFRLEQVDTNELVIDMQGEMTSLTVTPYKTLVTPNNILDDIDNIFQSEFKGTDTIDIIGEGPSETITEIETITPNDGISKFTEYQFTGTNISTSTILEYNKNSSDTLSVIVGDKVLLESLDHDFYDEESTWNEGILNHVYEAKGDYTIENIGEFTFGYSDGWIDLGLLETPSNTTISINGVEQVVENENISILTKSVNNTEMFISGPRRTNQTNMSGTLRDAIIITPDLARGLYTQPNDLTDSAVYTGNIKDKFVFTSITLNSSTSDGANDAFILYGSDDGIIWTELINQSERFFVTTVFDTNFKFSYLRIKTLTSNDDNYGHFNIGAWDISIQEDLSTTTFTSQTVDTNSLAITTDGTFDSLDYSTTISTPTEIVTDITKTITQDAQQENWTKYQLEAKNLDGTITVNGVEQIVESVNTINNDIKKIIMKDFVEPKRYKYLYWTFCIGLDNSTRLSTNSYSTEGVTYNTDEKRHYFASHESQNIRTGDIIITFHEAQKLKLFEFCSTPWYDNNGSDAFTIEYYNSEDTLLKSERYENLFNGLKDDHAICWRLDRSNSPKIIDIEYPEPITTFTEQLVDTNTLELAVSGTVERIDTKTYINEDIITTIQDTDSTIELEISDLPYTLTQEVDQTDFNNYLVSGKGMTNQTVVTVNDLIQTVEFDIEGVSTLETTNDLFDIIRVFDYSVVVDEKTYDDITFTTPTTFTSLNTYETGKNLLLDNLNYSEVSSIEQVPQFRYENGDADFDSTLTLTQDTEKNNWSKYQFSADAVNGDLIINESIQTVDRVEVYDIDFRYLFENGTSIDGGTINFETTEIFGYRVGGSGPKGYYSVDMQHLYDLGLRELKFNVTSGTAGAVYIGRLVNGEVLDYANNANIFYSTSDIDYTLNLETKVLSYVVNGGLGAEYTAVPDLTNVALEHIVIGTSAIQASEYWQQWNVIPMSANKTYYTEIECDTNELIISGDAGHVYYNTTETTHLLPTYTVEHKAYSKQTDIDGNVTHSFNTTEEYPYTEEVLPTTIREFEFPTLAVSYYDIDLETTIGPIDKQYDSINISEENIIFDYNDETKVNTNKISFEPENIKEIIIKSKKIQEDN